MFRDFPQMIEDKPNPYSPEYRRLWAAVLNQAKDDLFGVPDWADKNGSRTKEIRREKAEAWFKDENHYLGSFLWVCDTLKIDPVEIRRQLFRHPGAPLRHPGESRDPGDYEKYLASPNRSKALDRRQRALRGM